MRGPTLIDSLMRFRIQQRATVFQAGPALRRRGRITTVAIAQPPPRWAGKAAQEVLQLEGIFHDSASQSHDASQAFVPETVSTISLRSVDSGSLDDLSHVPTTSGRSIDDDSAGIFGKLQLPEPLRSLLDKVPPRVRGLVMLNLLVVLVSTNWVVVKDAGTTFDPFFFASLRFGVAALALSPFLLKAKKQTLRAGLELGIFTAIGYLAQSQGLLTTDASRASFLSTFTVLVVPFAAGLSGRGVRPITWAAATAALVGVSMLEQSGAPPCLGDLWSAISAVAFGVQIFRTEHWSRVLGRRQIIPLMSVVLGTTAALATAAAAGTHVPELVQMVETHGGTVHAVHAMLAAHIPWLEVVYTGILTTDLVLLMELMALRDVTSTEAAIIYTLEPVLGAGFAFAALGERWGPLGWAGAGLIVASCLGMQIFGREEGEPVAESESE